MNCSWPYELAGFRLSIREMQDLAGLGLRELPFFAAAVGLLVSRPAQDGPSTRNTSETDSVSLSCERRCIS